MGWEDLLEGVIIDLRDVAAEHAQLFERLLWIWTSLELRIELLFEGPTPISVFWRSDLVDLGFRIG